MTLTTQSGNKIQIENPEPYKTFKELFPTLNIKEDENTKI